MPRSPSFVHFVSILTILLHLTLAANVFEQLSDLPKGWSFLETPKDDDPIQLRISLKEQNIEKFEKLLIDISTPDHELYGQHMQPHEIRSMLQPTAAATRSVTNWLQLNNVTSIEDDSDWIVFRTKVGIANEALDTKFLWYRNDDGQKQLRTLQYSVPDQVAKHINFIHPTIKFSTPQAHRSTILKEIVVEDTKATAFSADPNGTDSVEPACNATITPECLLRLYNVKWTPDVTKSPNNKVAFASFLEQYARYSDLEGFQDRIAQYTEGHNFTSIPFNGGTSNQSWTGNSGEANLDAQYLISVGYPVPVTEYSTGGRGPLVPDLDQPSQSDDNNEPYLEYLTEILKLPADKLPQVISHSYGESEQSVPRSFAIKVCQMFGQLGARGVTVLFSSGDAGVGTACQSNNGWNKTEFQPAFPATCPWVTTVGGTQYIEPEHGAYFSGGGFSRVFPRPSYQDQAVRGYLSKLEGRFRGFFHENGRGFPDISAQAFRYQVFDKGGLKLMMGTSCSAPTVAGMIGLLNAARTECGLKPLGFLNIWLYTVGWMGVNDITQGGNTGCTGFGQFDGPSNGSPVIPFAGFNATEGWDPVTGLGTPDFDKWLRMSTPWIRNEGGVFS